MSRHLYAIAMLHCNILAFGCGGDEPVCVQDIDCASGFCKADGTCGPADVDAAVGGDAPGDAIAGTCTPDHDGAIGANEIPLAAGKSARFRVATNATFDTAGQANGDGSRSWDLTGTLAGDVDREVTLLAPAGQWWEASFPGATYAVKLSESADLLGVFTVKAAAVELVGVVSPEAGTFRTELAYDPPAAILAVPFSAGNTWSSTSTVSGTAQGAIVAYTERYQSRVDEVGTMTTPYGPFPVLRIATDLERTQGLATLAKNRTFAWTAECFGSVATVTSRDFESEAEFNDPAEVKRLVP
jgi:hypothetical protein